MCEVTKLGKKGSEPRKFQVGQLKVIELLSPSAKELINLELVTIRGCEGLKQKGRVIVCIGIESTPDGQSFYCVLDHRGTNCKIGHRLSLRGEKSYGNEDNKALLELAKK